MYNQPMSEDFDKLILEKAQQKFCDVCKKEYDGITEKGIVEITDVSVTTFCSICGADVLKTASVRELVCYDDLKK